MMGENQRVVVAVKGFSSDHEWCLGKGRGIGGFWERGGRNRTQFSSLFLDDGQSGTVPGVAIAFPERRMFNHLVA